MPNGNVWDKAGAARLCHAISRSIVLIVLGIFLTVSSSGGTNISFMNVLTQIGLGYTFLFLFWGRSFGVQAIGAVAILVGTWLLYVLYPAPTIDVATGAPEVGIAAAWSQEHLQGIATAWQKNANVGHAFDVWFLNLFPRSKPFEFNNGGYQTINFIPSLATMLFGLMAGGLLRTERSHVSKIFILIAGGILGIAAGYALHWAGICPLVKRIWTPSWALFSTGWCCLILATLFTAIDAIGLRGWTFPITVVGNQSHRHL